jgi:capsular exopolysaccharide synthesis family protein
MGRSHQKAEEPRGSRWTSARTQNLPTEELAARLLTSINPSNTAAEAYRALRTNLIYALVDTPPKAIVMTSPGKGEGKSTTCANLGIVLSQAGKEVLIMDSDFRNPSMHKLFRLRNPYGMVDVLIGECSLQEAAMEPVPGLWVVFAGPIPPNPTEMLGSQRFTDLLSGVRQQFDYVLVDTSPVGLGSDAAILAFQSDGVLLVLDAQNTRKSSTRRALRRLEAVGAKVLGTVMNNVEPSTGGYQAYS